MRRGATLVVQSSWATKKNAQQESSFVSLPFTSEDKFGELTVPHVQSITDLVLRDKIDLSSLLYYVDFRQRSFGEAQAVRPSLSLQMLTVVSKLMQLCSSNIGLRLRRRR